MGVCWYASPADRPTAEEVVRHLESGAPRDTRSEDLQGRFLPALFRRRMTRAMDNTAVEALYEVVQRTTNVERSFDAQEPPANIIINFDELSSGSIDDQGWRGSEDHPTTFVDPFIAGRGYGPVLKPFEIQLLHIETRINPLLSPRPQQPENRAYLKWNMVFPSRDSLVAINGSSTLWYKGRDQPATFPRISDMSIIIAQIFPCLVKIRAKDPAIGITCGEVVDALAYEFQLGVSVHDYHDRRWYSRPAVLAPFRHAMRRLDLLGKYSMYGGIYVDNRLEVRLLGAVTPLV
ncbi:hypothetical protein H0H93_008181 [Arthromyces matolae]|nr:hypothetical protein H0H93_008181 [Arthromyces matolae]